MTTRNGLIGMDRNTGQAITGLAYLRQRLADCLATPVGTTVMHRARGSALARRVDETITPTLRLRLLADAARALAHPLAGVPDFALRRLRIRAADAHQLTITADGDYTPDGRAITLDGVTL